MSSFLFPRYVTPHSQRELAFLDDHFFVHTESHFTTAIQEIQALPSLLFQYNLLLIVQEFSQLPDQWIDFFLQQGEVFCNTKGRITSVCFHGEKQKTRLIIPAKNFAFQKMSYRHLRLLRAYFDGLDLQPCSSLASAGFALLQRSWVYQFGWDGWKYHRHQRPQEGFCQWIRSHSPGARNDVINKEKHPFGYEIDLKNAYGWALACHAMPAGQAYWTTTFLAKTIFFAACKVTISRTLTYGIFPLREVDGSLSYPTNAGVYQTFLWSNQVQLCRDFGLKIELLQGLEWPETTHDFSLFPEFMDIYRDSFSHRIMQDMVKQSLVSGIGRLGMDTLSYRLTREGNIETDQVYSEQGEATDLWIHPVLNLHPESLPHLFFYVVALIMEATTREALLWASRGQLLGTNTDAVIVNHLADVSAYPQKGGAKVPMGTWRVRRIDNIAIPALRHLVGDGVNIRPGIPKKTR